MNVSDEETDKMTVPLFIWAERQIMLIKDKHRNWSRVLEAVHRTALYKLILHLRLQNL